jgi:hypothetical protein
MTSLIARITLLAGALTLFGAVAAGGSPTDSAARITRTERLLTIPAGTVLRVRVDRGFGSDISRVEDGVIATLTRPLVVNGRQAAPAGSVLRGYVTDATRPGRVKGRGRVAVRFTQLRSADSGERYSIRTRPWVAVARATKKKDALTIGVPAAGGALVGGLLGGKKGAGIGALTAGGAGTAVVLSTRGRDVRVGRGAVLNVRLTAPVTVRAGRHET